MDWRAGFVESDAVNVTKVCQEEGNQWCWNVERRREYNPNIAHSHLVDHGIIDNFNQERRQVPKQLKVGSREFMHKDIKALNLFASLIHV